jgi:putative colanic acid biosynthesis acetyltransferase WcaF
VDTGPAQREDAPDREIFQRLDICESAPYGREHYARLLLWSIIGRTLFRWSPRQLKRFRVRLLRLFGADVHITAHIRPSARIRHPWLLKAGQYSVISDNVNVYNLGPIEIGDHSAISQDAHLCAGTHDYTKRDLPLVRKPIVIGRGVWVCAEAFIGPGVHIGDNSVVGARAVVTKDVPTGVIVAGNPARVVRARPMGGAGGGGGGGGGAAALGESTPRA